MEGPGKPQDPGQRFQNSPNTRPLPPAVQKPPEPRKFTAEERTLVKKVLANIVNFLEEDNKSGRDLLGPFDPRNTGIIMSKELERAMYDDLFMVQDANTNLFVEYYSDHMGRVILGTLLSDLERFRKARVDKKNYDLTLVKDHLAANRLALVPKEKLAGFVPPKTDEKHASRMKERIEQIKDFFYYEHGWSNQQLFEKLDVNKDNVVTKREFFKQTIDSGMEGVTRDELDEVFKFVDSNKNGVISLKEFKYATFIQVLLL
jgi:EF-hand domain pair